MRLKSSETHLILAWFMFRNKPNLGEACALHGIDRTTDAAVRCIDVATDMHFRHIFRRHIFNTTRLFDVRSQLCHRPVEQFLRIDRKSTRLNSSHYCATRMPSSACKQKQHTVSNYT